MIKDVVVNLSLAASHDIVADYAISVADTFEAHIAGIAFAYEPVLPPVDMGAALPAKFIESQRDEFRRQADNAVSGFNEAARRAGLSSESRVLDASAAGAAGRFAHIARRFDLSIIGQAEPDKDALADLIIEMALFESGRPILVVPYIQKGGLKFDHVTVCWDGSRAAARAIADAMPMLARAGGVDVVMVDSERTKSGELSGADIGQHLARHGLKVEVKRIVASGTDVTSTILSYAADASTDLIVMGGYGHSRLREFVLGGATRGILASMTVPTLMSH